MDSLFKIDNGLDLDMTGIVPEPNDGLGQAVFIAQSTETGCAQHEGTGADPGFKPNPASSQHANKMT
jgi:hypothetical protein